jgi:16S rRNA (adenine1518-N6/adenine1519-N6)-dimethyltransferase
MTRPVGAPKKELGQHFLIDENLLAVIGRLAELAPEDIVLEVGPGLGVLTGYLADRVSRVHAVELDYSLVRVLAEKFQGRDNVELHHGDALRLDLTALRPAPTKLVANLPYNIATPLVVESLDGLPSVGLWCVMVQREVADRFFAEPSSKAYGAVSVLVQLASRRVKQVVTAAFAHRRKQLANSLELSGVASGEEAAAALVAIGRDPVARAEELAPLEFVALAEALDT